MLEPYLLHCTFFALLKSSGAALFPLPSIHIPDPIHLPSIPPSTPIPTQTPVATGVLANTMPICNLVDSNESTTLNMTSTYTDSATGKTINVYVDQIISKPGAHSHGSVQSDMSLRVDLDSVEVFAAKRVTSPQGSVDAEIDWRNLANGAHAAIFSIDNHNVTSGAVDGKHFTPVPLDHFDSTAKLERREQPLLHVTPSLAFNISQQELEQGITKGMQACKSEITAHFGPSNSSRALLLPRDDRTQDPGHFSDTYDANSCVTCEVAASVGIGITEAICIAATCWWTFGAGCVGCYAAAATGEFFALAGCNFSGACCPVNCGAGSYPTDPPNCCFGGETCINGLQGLCCSSDQLTCVGKACCNADQSCISSGPMQGSCCPPDSVCGDLCCPSASDVCVGSSQCCAASDTCGTACCNPIDPTLTGPILTPKNFCADGSRNLCCPTGQNAVNGICCLPGAINCDGSCCFGSCSASGQCQPSITTSQCKAMGFLGTCDDIAGCREPGPNVCEPNGCCQNIPK